MDDPNSALPSDPTVDESYTRGSRPVQPRTRSGSRTSGNDKDPQKSATNRKETAGNKTRTSASSSVSTKERPARARTTTSRSASADDNGTELTPRPLSDDRWYRHKLARRIAGVTACLSLTAFISYGVLSTSYGQVIDTILMEGMMRSARQYAGFSTLITGLVSVPVLVGIGVLVAIVAAARRRATLAGRALGAVVGANVTTQILKDYVLTRPSLGVTTGVVNSLPSGHATVAVTLSLALIVVAPQWFRGPSAWIGWVWTSLMSVSVMTEGWHRPSDAITAALIAGAWALALSPIERRPRHGIKVQRIMVWVCMTLVVIAIVATIAAMWGFSMSAAAPGSGYGFEYFLEIRPWRSRVLGVAAIAWVSAICGLIIHEVDRLAGE